MKNIKKLVSLLLAVCLIAALSVTAFAATEVNISGGEGTTNVLLTTSAATFKVVPINERQFLLTTTAATFKVTVPTSLPVNIAADGTVTCAASGTAKIINGSSGPVRVTNAAINDAGSWTKKPFGYDFSGTATGTKQYTLKINDADTVSGTISGEVFGNSGVIAGGASAPITYAADAATQSVALSGETIASVIFTVAWNNA